MGLRFTERENRNWEIFKTLILACFTKICTYENFQIYDMTGHLHVLYLYLPFLQIADYTYLFL